MTTRQLDVGRALAGFIIDSLGQEDQVGLVTLDGGVSLPMPQCNTLLKATFVTKNTLHRHLNNVHRNNYKSSDHLGGIEAVQRLLDESALQGPDGRVHVFYITAGNYASPNRVFQAYEKMVFGLKLKFVLHMYYMNNSNSKKDHDLPDIQKAVKDAKAKGLVVTFDKIDSTFMLSFNVGDFFNSTEPLRHETDFITSSPRRNDKPADAGGDNRNDGGLIITMTRPVITPSNFYAAVVGIGMYQAITNV